MLERLMIGAALALVAIAAPAAARDTPGAPLYQLRVYQLNAPSKALFHARFRDSAMRMMKRCGFDIAAIWEADHDGKPDFVYLLRWKDEAAMKAGWDDFMRDAGWARVKRDTVSPDAPIVGEIDSHVMRLTDYSPGRP